jgi:hypothetical protein
VKTFTYRPDANFNGADTFRYQALDGTGASAIVTVTIQVTPVNDPPVCTVKPIPPATDESGPIVVANWLSCSPGPADEAAQLVVFVLQGNSNPALFAAGPTVDASGTLQFTPQPNMSGSAQIELKAVDNGGIAGGGNDTFGPAFASIVITKPHALLNAAKPNDVSGDGLIVAADALEVINYINAFRAGPVPVATAGMKYLDTNHDNFITAADALEVINYINAFGADSATGGTGGEGEAANSAGSSSFLSEELLALLGADANAATKRKR